MRLVKHPSGTDGGRAVVIGGSVSGMMAARVLTDHFDQVTIVERDCLPDAPEFRHGVPQAYHAHILLPRGQEILEQLFPGLADELLARGAIAISRPGETALYLSGGWHMPPDNPLANVTCSRPLLETAIYRRLASHPKVRVIQEYEVVGLSADSRGQRVAGVNLHHRHDAREGATALPADLVVDACGRYSQAPQWLENLGYTPPLDTVVDAFAGYSSRIYRRPATFNESWKIMYVRPTPPIDGRGGVILSIEGNRWHISLIGLANDYPPTDEEGFLAFARSLPTRRLYEAIKDAEPLTVAHGYRDTANRLRHYHKLSRHLEGFVVIGDAVHTMNPVYAQGITLAAGDSLALDRTLKRYRDRQADRGLTGFASAFQKELMETLAGTWRRMIREDRRWPATEEATEGIIL